MSWDIEPYDWYKKFFGSGGRMSPFGRGRGFDDMFREFEDMRKEFEGMFEGFGSIEKNAPKELVREYETPDGKKVREVGPIVYGYSMTIGPDGKPKVREFGNIHASGKGKGVKSAADGLQISAEREPLVDVTVSENDIKVTVELPGVKKEDIKINAYEGSLEIITDQSQRKYHKTIDLPQDADIESAKSTHNNGIVEVTFRKKQQSKPKGKEVKIE